MGAWRRAGACLRPGDGARMGSGQLCRSGTGQPLGAEAGVLNRGPAAGDLLVLTRVIELLPGAGFAPPPVGAPHNACTLPSARSSRRWVSRSALDRSRPSTSSLPAMHLPFSFRELARQTMRLTIDICTSVEAPHPDATERGTRGLPPHDPQGARRRRRIVQQADMAATITGPAAQKLDGPAAHRAKATRRDGALKAGTGVRCQLPQNRAEPLPRRPRIDQCQAEFRRE
jgi:hypothetical protein